MVRTLKPTWRSRRLGQELRRLRDERKLGSEEVAEQFGWDRTKVSRIETARVYVSVPDCERLLDLYGVSTPTRTSLMQLAKNAKKQGWWISYGDVFTGSYVDMEDVATEIDDWETQFIPGLLQTPEYARTVIKTGRPSDSPEDIERRLRARMARKPLLHRDDPPQLNAVIDEAVLRRMQGEPDVLTGQIRVLLEAPPNVTVRVLPFSAGWHAGMDGSCVVLHFAEEFGPPKAYVDTPGGDVYVESVGDVRRCTFVFNAARDAALTPEESVDWLDRLAKECTTP